MAAAASAEYRPQLEAACREVFGESAGLVVEVDGAPVEEAVEQSPLMRQALADGGVIMVRQILGGEIVDVRPNGEAN